MIEWPGGGWSGSVHRWLHGEVKTPPFTEAARREAGALLRRLQLGDAVGMPHSRPMPSIGPRCHELRVRAADNSWRILYRVDADAIVIAGVHQKRTAKTPKAAIDVCRARLGTYDAAAERGG